jgi:hypothetical protein
MYVNQCKLMLTEINVWNVDNFEIFVRRNPRSQYNEV